MFKIYTTSGTYPNLSLDTELFSHSNVSINGSIKKTLEDDIIPLESFPDVWDSYTVNKNVKVSGTLSNADEGVTTVAESYKTLDKIMMDYGPTTAWSDQPDFTNADQNRQVLAFLFYIPNGDTTDTTITYYGVLSGFDWNFASGAPQINYNLTFKSYARKWIL